MFAGTLLTGNVIYFLVFTIFNHKIYLGRTDCQKRSSCMPLEKGHNPRGWKMVSFAKSHSGGCALRGLITLDYVGSSGFT